MILLGRGVCRVKFQECPGTVVPFAVTAGPHLSNGPSQSDVLCVRVRRPCYDMCVCMCGVCERSGTKCVCVAFLDTYRNCVWRVRPATSTNHRYVGALRRRGVYESRIANRAFALLLRTVGRVRVSCCVALRARVCVWLYAVV